MGESLFNVGRKLTPEEWGELCEWKKNNASLKYRRGDVREDGAVFMYYAVTSKNGERWVDPAVIEKTQAKQRQRHAADRERNRAACREYYAKNAEKQRAKRRRQYREAPEASLRASRKWKANNPGRVAAGQRKWVEANRDKISEKKAEKYRGNHLYRLATLCRNRTRAAIRLSGYKKLSKTSELLGCDWGQLKAHMEAQFADGMGWGNQSEWHIDHRIPLASAQTEEELIGLCHYSNLQPMWALDNLAKRDKMPNELPA